VARHEAASAATAGAAAAAQRPMDRVRGSGLPPRVRPLPDGCPFVFAKISSFMVLESRRVAGLAYPSCPRLPNEKRRLGRRMYDVKFRKRILWTRSFEIALNDNCDYTYRAVLPASRAQLSHHRFEPTRQERARETRRNNRYKKLPPKASAYLRARGAATSSTRPTAPRRAQRAAGPTS
jgi:hypothetical protein